MTKIINLTLYNTLKCNLNCSFCYLGKENLNSKKMSFEKLSRQDLEIKFNEIFSEISVDNSILYDVQVLGGDITMDYIFLKNLIRYFFEKNIIDNILHIRVFTNGILIDTIVSKLEDDLKENIFKIKSKLEISISLHGLKEIHDNMVGKQGVFMKVINNIIKILDKNYNIRISIVINSQNIEEVIKLIILLEKIGIKNFTIFSLYNSGNADKNLIINFFDDKTKKRLYFLLSKIDFFRKKGIKFYINLPFCILKGFNDDGVDQESNKMINKQNDTIYYISRGEYIKRYLGFNIEEKSLFIKTKELIKFDYYNDNNFISNIPKECNNCNMKNKCIFITKGEFILNSLGYGIKIKGESYF